MGVAFVAHCLLNQNSKVRDGAHCAGVYSPIVDVLRARGWLIMELGFTSLEHVQALLSGWDSLRVVPDLAGIPRVIAARVA